MPRVSKNTKVTQSMPVEMNSFERSNGNVSIATVAEDISRDQSFADKNVKKNNKRTETLNALMETSASVPAKKAVAKKTTAAKPKAAKKEKEPKAPKSPAKEGSVADLRAQIMQKKKECHDNGDKEGVTKYTIGSKYVSKSVLKEILGMEVDKKKQKKEKDPNAPTRPLGSYMSFVNSERAALKAKLIAAEEKKREKKFTEAELEAKDFSKNHPSLKATEITSQLGAMWTALKTSKTKSDQAKFKKFADQEKKERTAYQEKKNAYDAEINAHKKPKQPLTSFFLFCRDNKSALQTKYPELKVTEISKKCGEMWTELKTKVVAKEKKAVVQMKKYTDENVALKAKHEIAYKEWAEREGLEINPKTGRVTPPKKSPAAKKSPKPVAAKKTTAATKAAPAKKTAAKETAPAKKTAATTKAAPAKKTAATKVVAETQETQEFEDASDEEVEVEFDEEVDVDEMAIDQNEKSVPDTSFQGH